MSAVEPLPAIRADLRRTVDPTVFNLVANSPEVRPFMGGPERDLDFGPVLQNLQNYGFANAHGGFLIARLSPRRYEWHTLFGPGLRGAAALAAASDVLRFMFAQTDAEEIVTRVPASLPHADLMARRAGFSPLFHMDHGWRRLDGEVEPMHAFRLTLDEWRTADPTLVAEGETFHALLAAAAAREGDTAPLHPHDDDDHERAAGMASLMAKAGNHLKAVAAYGRWADLAGFRPIELLSANPAVFHVGNALVSVINGELEVLKWLRAP